jgi:hypothetical protein
MNIEIAEYSAFLVLPNLDVDSIRQIEQIARELLNGLAVSVGPRHLEFDYSGRDTGRKYVQFLCRIAPLIGSAEGEVECVLTTDADKKVFEFYAIKNFRLYREDAKLVKLPPVEVCLEIEEAALQPA